MTERVFVSYSHHDASLVTPVVRLLRSTNDFVFQDADSIKPGEKWREALGEAIEQASLVVVFWCLHSNESPEVEREYRSAIEAKKDVLPVLLDSTPVPPALGEFQWIDFRELGRGRHPTPGPFQPLPAPMAAPRPRWLAAIAASATVIVLMAVSFWTLRAPAPQGPIDVPPPAPVTEPASASILWVVLPALLLLAGGFFAWSKTRGTKHRAAGGPPATSQEKEMAQTLEEELRRRLRPRGA